MDTATGLASLESISGYFFSFRWLHPFEITSPTPTISAPNTTRGMFMRHAEVLSSEINFD